MNYMHKFKVLLIYFSKIRIYSILVPTHNRQLFQHIFSIQRCSFISCYSEIAFTLRNSIGDNPNDFLNIFAK